MAGRPEGGAPTATSTPRWRIGPHLLTDAELLAASRDWRILARPEQQPPSHDWRTWAPDGRARLGQDAGGGGMGAWSRTKKFRPPHRAGGRNFCRRTRGDDRRAIGHYAHCRAGTPGLRNLASQARLAERLDGLSLLVGRPRKPARPAISCRLVRRTRQVEARRSNLRHAAIRPAPRCRSAPAGDDHAAPAAAPQTPDG